MPAIHRAHFFAMHRSSEIHPPNELGQCTSLVGANHLTRVEDLTYPISFEGLRAEGAWHAPHEAELLVIAPESRAEGSPSERLPQSHIRGFTQQIRKSKSLPKLHTV